MSAKLHLNQTENVFVADEALESARQLASWPCNDVAVLVRTHAKAAGRSRAVTIIHCLALGAVAYYPEVWLHLTSLTEETGTEHTHEIAAPTRPSRTGKGFLAVLGSIVMRLWN
jgi:hypothetical protein